jgi:hypothetical protein
MRMLLPYPINEYLLNSLSTLITVNSVLTRHATSYRCIAQPLNCDQQCSAATSAGWQPQQPDRPCSYTPHPPRASNRQTLNDADPLCTYQHKGLQHTNTRANNITPAAALSRGGHSAAACCLMLCWWCERGSQQCTLALPRRPETTTLAADWLHAATGPSPPRRPAPSTLDSLQPARSQHAAARSCTQLVAERDPLASVATSDVQEEPNPHVAAFRQHVLPQKPGLNHSPGAAREQPLTPPA